MDLIPNKNQKNQPAGFSSGKKGQKGLWAPGDGKILSQTLVKGWGGKIFEISVLFLILAVVGSGVFYSLKYFTHKKVLAAKEVFDQHTVDLQSPEAQEYRNYVWQIEGLKDSLKQKVYSTPILKALEENTVVGITWIDLDLNLQGRLCDMTGETNNYSTVAKQIVAFREIGFSNIRIERLELEKGIVTFSASFIFPAEFKRADSETQN